MGTIIKNGNIYSSNGYVEVIHAKDALVPAQGIRFPMLRGLYSSVSKNGNGEFIILDNKVLLYDFAYEMYDTPTYINDKTSIFTFTDIFMEKILPFYKYYSNAPVYSKAYRPTYYSNNNNVPSDTNGGWVLLNDYTNLNIRYYIHPSSEEGFSEYTFSEESKSNTSNTIIRFQGILTKGE